MTDLIALVLFVAACIVAALDRSWAFALLAAGLVFLTLPIHGLNL